MFIYWGNYNFRWRKYPVSAIYSGFVHLGFIYNCGTIGYYWSVTNYSNSAYGLDIRSNMFGLSSDYKYYGWSVRCVALGV